jgi:hypothetical protein
LKEEGRRKKEEGRRKKEEGRRKKEEGRRKKEEGRRKKEVVGWVRGQLNFNYNEKKLSRLTHQNLLKTSVNLSQKPPGVKTPV